MSHRPKQCEFFRNQANNMTSWTCLLHDKYFLQIVVPSTLGQMQEHEATDECLSKQSLLRLKNVILNRHKNYSVHAELAIVICIVYFL